MHTIRAILIDDEQPAREALRGLLNIYCPEIEVVAEAANIQDGRKIILELTPDIVFLDIEIGSNTGFQLIESLNPIPFHLIFTTAYSDFALKAFRANAIDYLLKPIEPQLLRAAVYKIIRPKENNDFSQKEASSTSDIASFSNKQLAINSLEGITFIDIENIVHLQGSGNYTTFHLKEGDQILASKGLKHFEKLLCKTPFFKTHQSHIVNLQFIKKIWTTEGFIIELKNGSRVPLSKKNKKELLERLGE